MRVGKAVVAVRAGVSCCILAVDDKTAAKCFAPDVLLLVKKDVYTVLFGIIELRTFFTQNAKLFS